MLKLSANHFSHSLVILGVVVTVAGVGLYTLRFTHAATAYGSAEAESGNLADGASLHQGSTASNAAYIQFEGAAPAKTPADVFDLAGWDLTLPIDAMGGTGGTNGIEYAADVITPQQLVAGFSDPYFELNSDNQLVFTAPSNGAVTTPGVGSDHVRSELHEYYTGASATEDGTWTSSLGGTLQASAVINAVSTDSDEVTFGQIHGDGAAAFVLLVYRPADQQVQLKVYDSPTTDTATDTTILNNISLGQTISYTLSFQDDIITATANGTTVVVAAGSDWNSYPVRFDVGAYSAAPNTGNPAGDKTQVTFNSFEVSH